MPLLPHAYLLDARRIAETAAQLLSTERGQPETVPAIRVLASEIRDFLTRWQGQPQVSSQGELLALFHSQLVTIERRIESLHLVSLQELLETRRTHLLAELCVKLTVEFANHIRNAPPDLRPEMEREFREHHQHDYDSAVDFQNLTDQADKEEANWSRLIREYELRWPERLEDSHYVRIQTVSLADINPLEEELDLRKKHFDESHPRK